MIDTTEKIKNGTIRIENGRLVGLGLNSKESLDLNALDKLMSENSPREVAEQLDETIMRIGSIGLELNWDGAERIPWKTFELFFLMGTIYQHCTEFQNFLKLDAMNEIFKSYTPETVKELLEEMFIGYINSPICEVGYLGDMYELKRLLHDEGRFIYKK